MAECSNPNLPAVYHVVGLQGDGELDLQLAGEGDHGTKGAAGEDDAAAGEKLPRARPWAATL